MVSKPGSIECDLARVVSPTNNKELISAFEDAALNDIISLSKDSDYFPSVISGSWIVINKPMTIECGPGTNEAPDQCLLDADFKGRVMKVENIADSDGAVLTINRITIKGGNKQTTNNFLGKGGGILIYKSTVNLNYCVLEQNKAEFVSNTSYVLPMLPNKPYS